MNMDAVLAYLPDNAWTILIFVVLVLLNIFQFAKYHGTAGKLAHLLEHGHAPSGTVIVPASAVVVADAGAASVPIAHSLGGSVQTQVPPWERKS